VIRRWSERASTPRTRRARSPRPRHGEAFIRAVLAYDVAARMRYRGETLAMAARRALDRIVALKAEGGLIAVDRAGRVAMPFVSQGMYRGAARGGRYTVAIYR